MSEVGGLLPRRVVSVDRLRLCSAVACVLIGARALVAEQVPVRALTTAEGLPRDQLACVASDERGFIWFCTDDGLARFDGHAVVTFGPLHRGDLQGLRSFLHTRDGRYFVGHRRGLMLFNPATDGAHRFAPVRRPDGRVGAVNSIMEARDGTIWCGTADGLFRLAGVGKDLSLAEVPVEFPQQGENDATVRAVVEDAEGILWIGAGSGLYRRGPDGHTVRFRAADGLPDEEVRALALEDREHLWVATRDGLCLINPQAPRASGVRLVGRTYTARDGLPASNIHSLLMAGDRLWVGTVLGVAALALDRRGTASVSSVVRGFYAWGLARDARGDIWVATEAGARRVVRRGVTTLLREDGLSALRISSVFETPDGRVCAVALMGEIELSCFDERAFHRIGVGALRRGMNPGWGWSQIAFQDRLREWWLPTGGGLVRVGPTPLEGLPTAPAAAVLTMRDGLRSNDVFRVFQDSSGGVWIATFSEHGNGLNRFDTRSGRLRAFGPADGLPDGLPLAHSFAEDRIGQVWIGLEQGLLLRYRGERFDAVLSSDGQTSGASSGLTAGHLRALHVDRRGRLWIASTAAGLGRLDEPGQETPGVLWYGKAQDLSSETIWSIAEQPSGELFLGTAGGIDRFNPDTGRVVRYGAEDGLPRGEILGSLSDRRGRIWFATTAGLARLVPLDEPVPVPPSTFVSAVLVNGTPLDVSAVGESAIAGLRLQPDDTRLEVDYVSPGSREADGLRYQYLLDGVDRSWSVPTERRSVVFAGVAPGHYRFRVRSLLPGAGAGDSASVSFEVLAPAWRRPWVLVPLFIGAGVLLAAAYRARVGHLLAIERVRTRIAADLHDDVGASLSRIAILSEVVRGTIGPVQPDAAALLGTIAEEARTVVDGMEDVVWLVDPHLDNLQAVAVRLRTVAAALFDVSGVVWSLEAPPPAELVSLTPDERRHVFLILKEALANVWRHAHAEHVAARIRVASGRLLAEVADDGAGVGPEAGGGRPRGGHGVDNMHARAALLGGTLTIGVGPGGRGTRVALEFSLRGRA